MRLRPSGWPDREAAQRLLDGATPPAGQPATGSGSESGPDSLALLLAAATAAPQPGELAGEDAALVAFRAAASDVPARPPVVSRPRPNSAIAWIAGLATVATAGVAVAAGGLGGPDTPAPPPASTVPSRDAPTGPTGSPDPTTSPAPTPSADSAPPTGRTTADQPDERALCAALLTKGSAERGRSLDSSAYRRLVADAGGRDDVDGYCRRLLDTPPQQRQRPTPTPDRTAGQGPSTPPNQAVTQPTPGRR